MPPDTFRDRILGPWSSHPDWERRRRWRLVAASLAPLAAVVLWGLLHGGGPAAASLWLTAFAAALTFALAALVTLAVCARVGEWHGDPALKRLGERPGLPFPAWLLVAALLLGAAGPFLLSRLSDAPLVRLTFQLFALFPLAGLLLGLTLLERRTPAGPRAPADAPLDAGLRSAAAKTPPPWLEQLLKDLHLRDGDVRLLEPGPRDVSPVSGRTEYRHLFGGVVPTEDQAAVLERFDRLYRELLDGRSLEALPDLEDSPDLLVSGDPGSGRTTALLACAVYAAFVRGQRVLFVVPDSLRQESVQERVGRFLEALRLHHYLRTAALTGAAVERWLAGAEPLPRILVATPQAVEEHLYGRPDRPGARRLVLLPEVLLIDDLLDFRDAERSHLPFLIDKHRLLLASEYLPLQVVVACGRLAPLGEESLGRRLFTVRHLDRSRNVLPLRPRAGARAWRARVEADDLPGTVERLAGWCLQRGLDVVLYRADLDEQERRAQESHLARLGGPGTVSVLTSLDRPLTNPMPASVDAVFHQEAQHHDVCLALRLYAGNDETVIFSLASRGAVRGPSADLVPVVADRSALPLLLAHLGGALAFMRKLSPVPAGLWDRFGLDRGAASELAPGLEVEAVLRVDEPDEADRADGLWPFIALERPADGRRPVSVFGLPEALGGVCRSAAGDRLYVVRPGADIRSLHYGRRACWFDGRTAFGDAGEVDLAHAHEFRLILGRRSIGLRTIEQDPDGRVRLIADVWHGSGIDRYLPVWHLAWTLPTGQTAGRLWGGPDDGLRWFELDTAGTDSMGGRLQDLQPLSEQAACTAVEAQILGHMSESAQVTDLPPVAFRYPARFSGLLFAPGAIEHAALSDTIGGDLQGAWSTGDDPRFWPVLTAAFNHAVRVRLPGLHYFARLLAFELPDSSRRSGAAVLWVVEPFSGGTTAGGLLSSLLRHPAHRARLFGSAAAFLEQLRAAGPADARTLRQATRLGFRGDERVDRIEEAQVLLQSAQAPR